MGSTNEIVLTEDAFDTLEFAVSAACPEGSLETDYSGRCMYGDECIAFYVDDATDFAKILVRVVAEDEDLANELADRIRTDSLGLGAVIYFPGIKAPESRTEDEA